MHKSTGYFLAMIGAFCGLLGERSLHRAGAAEPASPASPTTPATPTVAPSKSGGVPSPGTGTVAGRVRLNKAGGEATDPSGIVVYLEGLVAPGGPATGAAHPQVRQRDLQFMPALTVVVQGTTVDFPNDDKVFHNVFSFSEAAKFDLGLYKSGSSKSVTMHKPGVVNVYCNIHPEMISKIKVLDSTYFAIVGADGAFRIEQVPVGSYPLVAWQANGSEARSQVTVTAAGKTQIDLTLTQGRAELRHTRKDGTPYGRYK